MTAAHDGVAISESKVIIEHQGPASRRALALNWVSRRTAYPLFKALAPIAGPRTIRIANLTDYPGVLLPRPWGVVRTPVRLDDCPAEWLRARGAAAPSTHEGAILYFHGGAFFSCGLRTHRPLASRVSEASGLPVLNVAYRQLPKASVAVSLADGLSAYRHLLATGHDPNKIIIIGDSAGAFVGLSTMLAARTAGLPLPAAMVGLSPLVDFDLTHKASSPYVHTDPLIPLSGLELIVRVAEGIGGTLDPALAPMQSDLAGFPPTLIQVGSTEIVRIDAEQISQRLGAAGVDCRLQIWDQQIHVFQGIGGDFLPEAKAAIRDIGDFIGEILKGSSHDPKI